MTTVHVYNTLSQSKETLRTVEPGKVSIYVCGMTVYDYCHIGHGRVLTNFDVIVRFLRHLGYEVIYVRNITDIDDKIINQAQKNNENWRDLAERFIAAMHEDLGQLNILFPDDEPRATEYLKPMQAMIQSLLDQGYAYQANNGDIYYQVSKFRDYGNLAHQDADTLRSGARVEVEQAKRDPLDFVLWKRAKEGEPSWPSPWGDGRPGWHIECSAMSVDCLGADFDIHGGGRDLQFPHHQNEIAQSQSAINGDFAHYWLHTGYVEINKEKMSKSLDNFFTIREVLEHYSPEVVRYFMIAPHYRSPINYSLENLDKASAALERLYTAMRHLPETYPPRNHVYEERFNSAMADDFNTPEAIKVLFDIVREINTQHHNDNIEYAAGLAALLKKLGGVLGILQQQPEQFLHGNLTQSDVERIEALIRERSQARLSRQFQRADEIRDMLKKEGILLEDKPQGTIWRVERHIEDKDSKSN